LNSRIACTLACLVSLAPGLALAQSKPAAPAAEVEIVRPAAIDKNGVLLLVRSTLLALHHANTTGNYTVLRDLAAPGFRDANNAARLADIFANLRTQNVDLAGAAVLEPQLTILPRIEPNGMMRLAGFFPSIPVQINFELLFEAVDQQWRPFGISVGLASSSPVAPKAAPAKAPDAEGAKKKEGHPSSGKPPKP
jgi:hypothetical protein